LIVLPIILAILLIFGVWEYRLHLRNLRRVPLRIHVNGTRGKSSVTRLIAAGLRASGVTTCAKTTGSRPRMILENGSEYTVQRQGRANIIEQLRAVGVAARRNAQALVVECMALHPALQELSEKNMIQSSIGVITNVRADHLDVMGPAVEDVARAVTGTIPRKGTLVTAESDPALLKILQSGADSRGTTLLTVTPEAAEVDEECMAGFSYVEHPENVAVALKVCELAGVDHPVAVSGMHASEPDVGALRVVHLAFYDKEIAFINAFAANDPDSSLFIWDRILKLFPGDLQRIAILACRADRGPRSVQLGKVLPRLQKLDRALLTGSGTRLALEAALKGGIHPEKIIEMEGARTADVFERSVAQVGKTGTVFGMGNVVELGRAISEYFNNRAKVEDQEA
jgi:poly-gamma-glutamate synthase PgsB/CapB